MSIPLRMSQNLRVFGNSKEKLGFVIKFEIFSNTCMKNLYLNSSCTWLANDIPTHNARIIDHVFCTETSVNSFLRINVVDLSASDHKLIAVSKKEQTIFRKFGNAHGYILFLISKLFWPYFLIFKNQLNM